MCDRPDVNENERASLIRWLVWNDPNGCYTDQDRSDEGLPPADLDELQKQYRYQTLTCAACCEPFEWDEPEALRPDPSYRSRTLMYHQECAERYDREHNV